MIELNKTRAKDLMILLRKLFCSRLPEKHKDQEILDTLRKLAQGLPKGRYSDVDIFSKNLDAFRNFKAELSKAFKIPDELIGQIYLGKDALATRIGYHSRITMTASALLIPEATIGVWNGYVGVAVPEEAYERWYVDYTKPPAKPAKDPLQAWKRQHCGTESSAKQSIWGLSVALYCLRKEIPEGNYFFYRDRWAVRDLRSAPDPETSIYRYTHYVRCHQFYLELWGKIRAKGDAYKETASVVSAEECMLLMGHNKEAVREFAAAVQGV